MALIFFIHTKKSSWSVGSHVCKRFCFHPLFHTVHNSRHLSQLKTGEELGVFPQEIKITKLLGMSSGFGWSMSHLCTEFWKPGPVSADCVCPTSSLYCGKCRWHIVNTSFQIIAFYFLLHFTVAPVQWESRVAGIISKKQILWMLTKCIWWPPLTHTCPPISAAAAKLKTSEQPIWRALHFKISGISSTPTSLPTPFIII